MWCVVFSNIFSFFLLFIFFFFSSKYFMHIENENKYNINDTYRRELRKKRDNQGNSAWLLRTKYRELDREENNYFVAVTNYLFSKSTYGVLNVQEAWHSLSTAPNDELVLLQPNLSYVTFQGNIETWSHKTAGH